MAQGLRPALRTVLETLFLTRQERLEGPFWSADQLFYAELRTTPIPHPVGDP